MPIIKNIITFEELSSLARPCSAEREDAEAMIAEAQRLEIKPRLGDALYLRVTAEDVDAKYSTLLNGGQWEDCSKRPRLLTGIKTALAYYTQARLVRDGNIKISTYGAVVKDDQYSEDPQNSERQRQYRELFSQADAYMSEAIDYLRANAKDFPDFKACAKASAGGSNRMTIRVIGK
ncbi:MAG: hypothetical protein II205_04420 [Bacteroidales bacterium]|nr:hypothetical protein [Bacteroidales bacterium]